MRKGKVYLVGAGPGDPGLLTLKAVECLRLADVVVFDSLANPEHLKYASPQARLIDVGKRGAVHTKEQEEINDLLARLARRGKTVVRLKGGDPFVFGRGGEEAEALAAAGIPFEIVPGVTSAIAAPAYAGIPVTHRDFAPTVAFVTGHEQDLTRSPGGDHPLLSKERVGERSDRIPWDALSQIGTVVFLMGVSNLPSIVRNLMAAGRDPETPAAVIEWGTLPRQRTAVGCLRTISEEVQRMGIRPPAVTVVGDVVSLRERLRWFERKPLFGKRIVVTRSREQASELSRRLQEAGAEVLEVPTIEIRPPSSWKGLDRAIGSLSRYHGIIFTSVNGVESFFRRLWEKGKDLRELKGLKIAAIGPATARAVEGKGIQVDTVAEEFQAEGLVRALARQRLKGKRILIPRAREAREVLVEELLRLGAKVDLVEAYRSQMPHEGVKELRRVLGEKVDLITFASSSTVENFMKMIGGGARRSEIPVASIGPITTETARRYGLNVVIQPKAYTIPALVEVIIAFFESHGRAP